MKKSIFSVVILVFSFLFLSFSSSNDYIRIQINTYISKMTLDEKIGQLFVIKPEALDSSLSNDQINSYNYFGKKQVDKQMKEFYQKYPCSGFILFDKNLENENQLIKFNNDLHSLNKIKPLIFIDEEGGKVARIANHTGFYELKFDSMFSEISKSDNKNDRAYIIGSTIGSYLNKYGFDVDFAPVADVYTNELNTVIGERSFSNNPKTAGSCAVNMWKGLKSQGVDGCFKHFPGHGDTYADSHAGSVKSMKNWNEMKKCELIPFKMGIHQNIDFIMTAHITCPNVTKDNLPASLSYELLTEKLRNEMNYHGIIITDSFSMGAITNEYDSLTACKMAIKAGADLILMPLNYEKVFLGLKEAVLNKEISEDRIDDSVYRIIKYKIKKGLLD